MCADGGGRLKTDFQACGGVLCVLLWEHTVRQERGSLPVLNAPSRKGATARNGATAPVGLEDQRLRAAMQALPTSGPVTTIEF